jgi:hypothetical protein
MAARIIVAGSARRARFDNVFHRTLPSPLRERGAEVGDGTTKGEAAAAKLTSHARSGG